MLTFLRRDRRIFRVPFCPCYSDSGNVGERERDGILRKTFSTGRIVGWTRSAGSSPYLAKLSLSLRGKGKPTVLYGSDLKMSIKNVEIGQSQSKSRPVTRPISNSTQHFRRFSSRSLGKKLDETSRSTVACHPHLKHSSSSYQLQTLPFPCFVSPQLLSVSADAQCFV